MLHLRLIVPAELTDAVIDGLAARDGVVHIVRSVGTSIRPPGEVVQCDVAREAANDVVEWLQDQGVHHSGAITLEAIDAAVSDAAAAAEASAEGAGGDALVWEELEGRAREESSLTVSFLVFMSVAAVLAAIGIVLDSAILVIGAMVAGPDYGPLAALCVGLVRRRGRAIAVAARTTAVGLAVAAGAALVASVLFRAARIIPERYSIAERELTSFIARPDVLAGVVAVLAGIIGMLSLTQVRSGALIGVLVSVTTIPAVGNIGLAAAYGSWVEVRGAALQLGVNIVGLVTAGVLTLVVQDRATARRTAARRRPTHRGAA